MSAPAAGQASRRNPAQVIVGGPPAAALVPVEFGVVLFARPDVGGVTLAPLFGLFSLVYGVSQMVTGVQLRQTGRTLQSARRKDAGPERTRRHQDGQN